VTAARGFAEHDTEGPGLGQGHAHRRHPDWLGKERGKARGVAGRGRMHSRLVYGQAF
jgi:hypothetical protein